MAKNLIIYYSRRGMNYVNGNIISLEKGNTEICAGYVQKAVGGDLFEVRTVHSYSKDYRTCTEEARQEFWNHERPELEEYVTDISAYDHIFVLGPCWWGTYPMAIFSLLERLDFHGKKICPLMTHEGSGMGDSVGDLHRSCPGATFGTGMAVHGADAKKAEQSVSEWAKKQVRD